MHKLDTQGEMRCWRHFLKTACFVARYLAAKTRFFQSQIRLPTLENRLGVMQDWCINYINNRNGPGQTFDGLTPFDDASRLGLNGIGTNRWYGYSFGAPDQFNPNLLWQCVGEQKWMRESMLRTLLYLQVPPRLHSTTL